MPQKTDIRKLQIIALTLLEESIELTEYSPMIVHHPFTTSGIIAFKDDGVLNLCDIIADEEAQARWRKEVAKHITAAEEVRDLLMLLQPQYGVLFLKLGAQCMSASDLGKALSIAWTRQENPNDDVNVQREEIVPLFEGASKKTLMDTEERRTYDELPDVVDVYRGVTSFNDGDIKALSWTLDKGTAEWFSTRFSENGDVYRATIAKEHVLAVFLGRDEKEVVVDPRYLKDIQKVTEE